MVMTANMSTEFLNTILPSNNDLQVDGKVIIVTHYLPIKCTLLNGDLKMNETVDGAYSEFHSSDYHLPLPTNVSDFATFSPEGSVLSPVSQTNSVNLESIRSNDVAKSQNGKEGYVPDSEMFQSNRSSSGQAAVTPSLISMNSSNANDSFSSVSRPGSSLNAVPRLNWKFTKRNDHSALYSGVLSLRGQNKCFYIGVVDKIYTKEGMVISVSNLSADIKSSLTKTLLEEHNALPVFLNRDVSFGHYEGFCKTALWPILHYILWKPSDGKNETKYWQSYNEVNSIFCRAIESQYKTGDVIWVHDYHFLTLPSMLRRALPDAVIGFFLHTPFPSSEIFRCIPQREKLLLGLLGSNMVGFQTYAYARHFISACTRILGVESNPKGIEYRGGHVVIATFPIGIDVKQVEEYRSNPAVTEKIKSIRELYANKKIIIGRDKLDHIKGVLHKLNAFEKFLEDNPDMQDQVVLIQVTSPTEAPSKLETKVSEMVSRINGQYGSLGFAPVHHYHHHIDRDEYYALLSVADVALITSVRDGMNTTSHEYVVCQKNNCGPLILSEFTGTAGSLSAAILVNPWDYVGVAMAIKDALNMSKEEKLMKHTQLYDYVMMNTAKFWAESFMKELIYTSKSIEQSNPTPVLDEDLLLNSFKRSKKRLFLLDYDGTLTAIRKTPNAAVPSKQVLQALEILGKDAGTMVYIISGRDQAALDGWLGHISNLGLSAEHGSFIKYANSSEWINLSKEIDLGWKNDVLPIFEYYTERTPGSFVEHKRSSLTWHYRLADPAYGSWQSKECHNHLENAILSKLPVEILLGKKNIEVRPQQINKGEIVKRLLGQKIEEYDFIFCAGDDKTDEDMFRALKKSGVSEDKYFTCTIGAATKKTQASWHVSKTEDLIGVLSKLSAILVDTKGK